MISFNITAKAVKLKKGNIYAIHRLFAKPISLEKLSCTLQQFEYPEIETCEKYASVCAS